MSSIMQYIPAKQNISTILKFSPIEPCDHLSQEEVRNKTVKLISTYIQMIIMTKKKRAR
jgi:hypothetical protein